MMKKVCILLALCCLFSAAGCAVTENRHTMSEDERSETTSPPLPSLPETQPSAPKTEVPEQPAEAEYLLVTARGLNVRAGAGVDSPVLGTAQQGTLLAFCGREGGWWKTRYRGRDAFVSADGYTSFFRSARASEEIEGVIERGCALLGTPYVYGATRFHDGSGNRIGGFSEDAFDCSSLMQYLFFGAGVLLDVTTRTQIVQGEHTDTPRRGDLLFFTNAARKDREGIERVGHVALYLGDGYILHTASDFAKIETVSAARQAYFLEARRVL